MLFILFGGPQKFYRKNGRPPNYQTIDLNNGNLDFKLNKEYFNK